MARGGLNGQMGGGMRGSLGMGCSMGRGYILRRMEVGMKRSGEMDRRLR